MMAINDYITEVVNQQAWEAVQQSLKAQQKAAQMQPAPPIQKQQSYKSDCLELGLDSPDFDGSSYDSLWNDLPDFLGDSSLDFTSPGKRKPSEDFLSCFDSVDTAQKRFKTHSEGDVPDFDSICYPSLGGEAKISQWPNCPDSGANSSNSDSVDMVHTAVREPSVDSFVSEDSCSVDEQLTAEYHFEQIRMHCQLASDCLRNGQYEKTKNIVTWAHDIKNKFANEVKKAAEKAWEADKDKEGACALRGLPRKPVIGSTKRVEQFRKNMRRWMTGTHTHGIGVEWMVFARMEHLQAIAAFILGDNLPDDPAGPSAVAESISKYLGQPVSQEFMEQELAEPEPGKRYTIGPGLVPYLNTQQPRSVPTLAFTMPSENDTLGLQSWVASLKELFPQKPAPKAKSLKSVMS